MSKTTMTYDRSGNRVTQAEYTDLETIEYRPSSQLAPEEPEFPSVTADEVDSIMRHLENLRTHLLWSYCEWLEKARKNELSPAELEARTVACFRKRQELLLAHLNRHLESSPNTIIVKKPAGENKEADCG